MKQIGTKRLETERLILRRVIASDADDAYNNWCNSDMVDKYVTWTKHENIDVTRELYKSWEEAYDDPKTYRWIVELKDSKEVIGTIDVSRKFLDYGTCEIGYCYGDKFWGKGYATEALKAVIKYLFEKADAELICAGYMNHNPASGRVMEKAGMKYEGVLRSRIIDKMGIRNDLIYHSITKDEYFEVR